MLQIDLVPVVEPSPFARPAVPAAPGYDGPLLGGHGPHTFRCGRCKHVVALNIEWEHLHDVVIKPNVFHPQQAAIVCEMLSGVPTHP